MSLQTELSRTASRRRPAVAEQAQRRLAQSPYRTIQRLSCRFDGRVLTLHGQLPSYYQNQLAQEAVAGLEGVDRVENHVQVVPELEARDRDGAHIR